MNSNAVGLIDVGCRAAFNLNVDRVGITYSGRQIRRLDARGCGIGLVLRDLASVNGAREVRRNPAHGCGQRIAARIGQPRLIPGHRRHLRDAMSHRAGAYNRYAADLRYVISDL